MNLASTVNKLVLFAFSLGTLNGCAYMRSGQFLQTVGNYDIGREDDGSCYVDDVRMLEEGDYFMRFSRGISPENDVPYINELLARCEEGEFDPVGTPTEPILDRI
ncbi:hypothetical protein HOC80_00575 [archaeon]|mgnify:CR=1 FL=1|jgi:hypothetical protein|nr:hypothetical protein [archaeon]MBT4416580.1 hypothetical protein [archaeon]